MAGGFFGNYSTITLKAPELSEKNNPQSIFHVRESVKQKNISSVLRSVLEKDAVLYHANARLKEYKSLYIVLKQVASTIHYTKTCHKTAAGEKSKLAEYLAMVQVSAESTMIESHGHTLSAVGHVMSSYCASRKVTGTNPAFPE